MQTPSRRHNHQRRASRSDRFSPDRDGEAVATRRRSRRNASASASFSPDRDGEAVATLHLGTPEAQVGQFQSRPGCKSRRFHPQSGVGSQGNRKGEASPPWRPQGPTPPHSASLATTIHEPHPHGDRKGSPLRLFNDRCRWSKPYPAPGDRKGSPLRLFNDRCRQSAWGDLIWLDYCGCTGGAVPVATCSGGHARNSCAARGDRNVPGWCP